MDATAERGVHGRTSAGNAPGYPAPMATPSETFAAALSSLSEDDRRLLQSSARFVSRVVASADSVVDKKEAIALEHADDFVQERLGSAFVAATEELPEALAAAQDLDWPQAPYLKKVAAIVRKLPAEAHQVYSHAMLELALSVAGASGGVLGFGEKLSADERYAIRRVVSALDLRVEDAAMKTRLGF